MVLLENAVLQECRTGGVASRIVLAIALRDGPLHDRADSLAHSSSRLALFVPDRQQHGRDVGGGNIAEAELPESRDRVVAKASPPLRC